MGKNSTIQWTDHTWNIATGCTKVDEDCKYCYMYREMDRYHKDPKVIKKTKGVFQLPLKIKEPSLIFASSFTDFFHEEVDPFRNEAWDIIRRCPHHIFQIPTKRPERILANLPDDWGNGWDNVWLGTSVGQQKSIHRVRQLLELRAKAKVLFLSLEPLHQEVSLDEYYFPDRLIRNVSEENRTRLINLIDWVIVGGESGNKTGKYLYRPCNISWLEQIVSQCIRADVPVFVKQLGTHLAGALKLSDRHGGDIEEFPSILQVRQMPKIYQNKK